MDPLTIGLQAGGLALQAFGAFGAASKAHEAADINIGIAGDEQQINEQKRLQMEMSARRQQVEVMRNAQRAGAQSTAAAANQGALFGSGYAGGQGQITAQATFDEQGINNNLSIGENIFSINNDISSKKMQLSSVQANQATDTALMSLGGSVVSNAGTIGNIGKFAGSGLSDYASLMRPGSLSGGLGRT
jgi:hypothetical protein